jgi:hypothetical protein
MEGGHGYTRPNAGSVVHETVHRADVRGRISRAANGELTGVT